MVKAKDQFGISGINRGNTQIASSLSAGSSGGNYVDAGDARGFVSIDQAERMLANPERYKMRPSEIRYLRGSMPGIKGVDASKNKVYSDMNAPSLGAKDGSLIAMANTDNRGITTAAPETKRMAGGFFSPKNFQKSGSPDATIMTREQIRQSLTGDPGYSRFGTRDAATTQAAKDTAAFNERVKTKFFTPSEVNPASISEMREQRTKAIRDQAAERNQAFKDTGVQTFGGRVQERRSGDDTYGTNVMSNPAFGFRSKMTAENQKRYDASSQEATRRAEVEPSKGNLITSLGNVVKRTVNQVLPSNPFTKEKPLETRGEAELRRYEKFINRPTYQREATARQEAGISIAQIRAKQQQTMRDNAAARNRKFQAEKRQKAVERAAKKYGQNTGSGRDGNFGSGTVGKGMPSNPAGMRQQGVGVSANDLGRHSPGTSKDQSGGNKSAQGMKDTNYKSIAKSQGLSLKTAKGQRAARKAAARAKAQNAAKKRKAKKSKK